jgi:hypothetical protein
MVTSAVSTLGDAARAARRRAPGAEWLVRHPDVIALFVYAIPALIYEHSAVTHFASGCSCYGSDPQEFMWSMSWWPYAIVHGLDPLSTHVIWSGAHSFNVAANTTIPLPALLAWPVTAIWGPIVSFNLINLIAPVLDAYVAYRLCRHITRAPAASILAGYVFGFSSYWWGELEGHTHLVFTFAAPAVVWLVLVRLEEAISARRFTILLALVLTAQLLCGAEMAFTLSCMSGVTLIAALVFADSQTRGRLLGLLPLVLAAYVAMAVICSPYIIAVMRGPSVAIGRDLQFPADALSFFVPSETSWIWGHTFVGVTSGFLGNNSENGTYLGIPIVLIVLSYAFATWERRATRCLVAVLAVAVVWALGDSLHIDGHQTISLPFSWIDGITGFNQLLPVRIGDYVFLICAIVTALWLAVDGGARPLRWAWALAGVALLLPNIHATAPGASAPLYYTSMNVPRFFSTALYRRYLAHGEVVWPIPYAQNGMSLAWQAETNMYFTLASGAFYEPNEYTFDPLGGQMIDGAPKADAASLVKPFVARHRIGAIVLQPGSAAAAWAPVLQAAGLTATSVGGVLLYRPPAAWRAAAAPPVALPAGCIPMGSGCP